MVKVIRAWIILIEVVLSGLPRFVESEHRGVEIRSMLLTPVVALSLVGVLSPTTYLLGGSCDSSEFVFCVRALVF